MLVCMSYPTYCSLLALLGSNSHVGGHAVKCPTLLHSTKSSHCQRVTVGYHTLVQDGMHLKNESAFYA